MKKVIASFMPTGGKHCITNALKQIFSYYGYPMSEAMIFGVASGLSFLYLNQATAPMVCGRTKVFAFEKKLAERLQIKIACKSSKYPTKIFAITKQMIDADHPVLIYVDMAYLSYLGMDPNSHFGGHAVVVFGYDEAKETFWISDRDHHDYPIHVPHGQLQDDFHLVDFHEIEAARNSSFRPFPAHNKYLCFDFHGYKAVDKQLLQTAIIETCEQMLYPPAKLLGINGIQKFSKEILKWKTYSPHKQKTAGITNYFQIHEDGGTGGGIFRKMYGEFLIEAAPIVEKECLYKLGQTFIDIAKQWDHLADALWEFAQTTNTEYLESMSNTISMLYEQEKVAYTTLLEVILSS